MKIEQTIVEHIVKDNKIIVKLLNGKVGVARCCPEDEFDMATGTMIALKRAYGLEEEKKEPAKDEFKVGDRVRFKTLRELDKEFKKNAFGDYVMGKQSFIDEMFHLCGTYATIEKINGDFIDLKDFTSTGDTAWTYTKEMVVKETKRITLSEFLKGGKNAVCLPNKKDYEEFIKVCHKMGKFDDYKSKYEEEPTINFCAGKEDFCMAARGWCSKKYFNDVGYKIYSVDEIELRK